MRWLADFVIKKGLLTKQSLNHLPRLFSDWNDLPANDVSVSQPKKVLPKMLQLTKFKSNEISRRCGKPRIRVCALWDTVSSIGFPIPSVFGWGIPTELGFVNSNLPEGVDHAFQAISLFERRFHFPPIVLRQPQERPVNCRLQQCWFSGYHGDIGGGNEKEALAHFALAWMIANCGIS